MVETVWSRLFEVHKLQPLEASHNKMILGTPNINTKTSRKVCPHWPKSKPEPMGKSKWRCKSSPQLVAVKGTEKLQDSTIESSSQIFFAAPCSCLIYMNFPRDPWNVPQNDTQSSVDVGIHWNLYKLVGGFDSTHLRNMLVKMDHFPKVRGENKKYLSCHHLVRVWGCLGYAPGVC